MHIIKQTRNRTILTTYNGTYLFHYNSLVAGHQGLTRFVTDNHQRSKSTVNAVQDFFRLESSRQLRSLVDNLDILTLDEAKLIL